jgi:SNF2 family DNA or RNA helicase
MNEDHSPVVADGSAHPNDPPSKEHSTTASPTPTTTTTLASPDVGSTTKVSNESNESSPSANNSDGSADETTAPLNGSADLLESNSDANANANANDNHSVEHVAVAESVPAEENAATETRAGGEGNDALGDQEAAATIETPQETPDEPPASDRESATRETAPEVEEDAPTLPHESVTENGDVLPPVSPPQQQQQEGTDEFSPVSPPQQQQQEGSGVFSPVSPQQQQQQQDGSGDFSAMAAMPSPAQTEPEQPQQQQQPSPSHSMQFPYTSSNFVAPLPTPIRPLAGDPRMAPTEGGDVISPSGATPDAYPSDLPSSQPQPYYEPPVPVTSTTTDPMTASFEDQWNQSVPVPGGNVGWSAPTGSMGQMAPVPNTMVAASVDSTMGPPSTGIMGDPVLTATPFPARSLVMQRVDDQTLALDATMLATLVNYGKSLSTPGHAAAFGVDLFRAAVEDDQDLNAHGWRNPYQPDEYDVLLQKGSIGLCMNMSVRTGCVTVTSFRRPEGGVIGPAEACGMIRTGDDLIAVDGYPIRTAEDFQAVVGRLKSLKPVLLRFRRPGNAVVTSTRPDRHGYRRGLRTSIAGLDNSEMTTVGMWNMGVRYLSPGQWAAELHVDGGGIRRLGVLPTEREAAMVYNRYIHQTYGPNAQQFMNPAGTAMGAGPDAQQGAGLPVAVSNVRDMKPIQRQPPARRLKAAFTNEQKEQLRAQIMVFKYVSTGTAISKEWLARAIKSAAPMPIQEGADRRKRKTFAPQAVVKPVKKAKRNAKGKKGKKKQYSDESDDDSESGENFTAPAREVVPTRRSGRNVGKAAKVYVEKENDSAFEDSEDEKPVVKAEAKKGPQIDKIVGIRFHKDSAEDREVTMEFLIKWKDVSHLHLSWLTTSNIEEFGHGSVMRMRRYLQKNSRVVEQARENVVIGEERDYSAYFSESFLEVDRILAMKEVEEPEEVNPYNNHGVGDDETPPLKRSKKYLVKWRDLSYVDCTWEWEDDVTDDRKIAAFHRYNHPPILNGAHPAMFEDVRPEPTSWAKYQESPVYNNQNTLRSYQLEGLNWLVFCWYNRRNCILADEMGLGKTVQATSILEHLRQREHIRGPFLVIAPLATLGNWKREIETWTSMNCVVYHDSEGGADIRAFIREHEFYYPNEMYKKRGIYKFNVMVTSYQTLMADAEYLDVIPWRYIVIDEAHKLKNRETKLLQSLSNFSWDSCLLMTGTPLQNGVYELWCLLNFIEPEKFTSQQDFYDQYGELNTAEQVARLHEQLRPYMLRRVKEDVEKSIPPKEETIIDVELTTMQKKYYRAIFERNRSFLNMGASGTVANLVNVEMELRKCCNHPFLIRGVEEKECGNADEYQRARALVQASGKTVLLDKLLAKFHAEKKKVLIFSQFKIMLDIIEDLCQLRQYKIERMDGSVRGNSRQAAIDRFNNLESDTFAFLLSTRAGGVGINLIAASVVILFDSDWNPQNDLQAVARCHRIGQTQSVNIYRLVTKKTYEAQMFDIASKKLGMHHAVFETGGVRNEFDGDDEGGNMMSLMSLDREKVEMMIRYGAYAIMGGDNEEEDPENRAINEVDIDQLLSSSRTIRYDPTSGENVEGDGEGEDGESKPTNVSQSSALSFSKASFTAETSDATIDFNDEQFWEKVLGPKPAQVLMTKVQEGWLSKAAKEDVKKFLIELRELARTIVQERQRGGQMEDADQVMSILIELKVTGPILNNVVNVRTVATEWLDMIERPKRRRNHDAESQLMYLEFLDGTKQEVAAPGKKKKKGGPGRRKSKASERRREEPSDSEDELEDDDDLDAPTRKQKRTKAPATGASSSTKSGIHIVLRKIGEADDADYEIVRTYSSVKKVQKVLDPDSAVMTTPVKKANRSDVTPKRRGRPPKKIVVEEEEDDRDSDEAESGAEEDAEPVEEAVSEDEDDEADEDDEEEEEEEEEDEDDDTPKKKKRKSKKPQKKPTPKKTGARNGTTKRKGSVDPQVDEEMWCRVCFGDQGFMDDPIVQCERCHVAVHKVSFGEDFPKRGADRTDVCWIVVLLWHRQGPGRRHTVVLRLLRGVRGLGSRCGTSARGCMPRISWFIIANCTDFFCRPVRCVRSSARRRHSKRRRKTTGSTLCARCGRRAYSFQMSNACGTSSMSPMRLRK